MTFKISPLTHLLNIKKKASYLSMGLFCIGFSMFSILTTCFIGTANAKELEPGIDAYIQFYPLFESVQSNIDTRNDKQILNSFDDKKKTQQHVTPYILGELSYTFSNKKTQLFLGTTEDNILDNTFYFQLGLRHYFDENTHIELSYLPDMNSKKVWQDPFVLGQEREKTHFDAQGFRGLIEFRAGIPIQLRYTFAPTKVDKDFAGVYSNNIEGNPLTIDQQHDLKRSGDYHIFDIKPIIPFIHEENKQLILLPRLTYTDAKLDGQANSYNGIEGAVSLYYKTDPIAIMGSLSMGQNDYQATHPIFETKRNDKFYTATLLFNYYHPFNIKNIGLNLTLTYLATNSNITFYDQNNKQISTGFWWRF